MDKEALLNFHGWSIDCYSPFEISTADGDTATGFGAELVFQYLKQNEHKVLTSLLEKLDEEWDDTTMEMVADLFYNATLSGQQRMELEMSRYISRGGNNALLLLSHMVDNGICFSSGEMVKAVFGLLSSPDAGTATIAAISLRNCIGMDVPIQVVHEDIRPVVVGALKLIEE